MIIQLNIRSPSHKRGARRAPLGRPALLALLALSLGAAPLAYAEPPPPAPPPPKPLTPKPFTLKRLYDRPNGVTDEERWAAAHGRGGGRRGAAESACLFPFVATALDARALVATVREGLDAPIVALYGAPLAGAAWAPVSAVALYAASGEELARVDLSAQLKALSAPDAHAVAYVHHALARDGALYVSVAHKTYARATGGDNARIYAYTARGAPLWRSPPLVSNAEGFLLVGDVLITGYGFTREPDLLYQLSRHTGEVLAKTPLKSGPERLALDELGVLHVRTYDRDVGFQLSR